MSNAAPRQIWMFSGQGSQYYQMGRELYEGNALFRRELEKADRIVEPLINESVVEIIYRPREDRFEPFDRIIHTHPALLMVEYALARVLLEKHARPAALLGYSLGELTCMVVSGAMSLEDALVAAVKMAEVITYCAPPGKMLAVLHSSELVDRRPEAFAGCEIASHNFPGNFVVTGLVEPMDRLRGFLSAEGINFIELPVCYPFHSSFLSRVDTPMLQVIDQVSVGQPRIPVLSALGATPVEGCSPGQLLDNMRCQVDFAETVRNLERDGPCHYVDLGPSGSMATTVKYNLDESSRSQITTVVTRFGQEARNLERLFKHLDTA